ncbi:MAG: hypothetical protein GY757_57145 [bacterium]|nr:hypothetical protein [bacterium]
MGSGFTFLFLRFTGGGGAGTSLTAEALETLDTLDISEALDVLEDVLEALEISEDVEAVETVGTLSISTTTGFSLVVGEAGDGSVGGAVVVEVASVFRFFTGGAFFVGPLSAGDSSCLLKRAITLVTTEKKPFNNDFMRVFYKRNPSIAIVKLVFLTKKPVFFLSFGAPIMYF